MAILSVSQPGAAGTNPSFAAASAGGDSFQNSGAGERLRVRNTDASSHTVTVVAQAAAGCPAGLTHNIAVAVPAGQERTIRGFDPARFNDVNNRVQLTYDAVTGVTVAVEL